MLYNMGHTCQNFITINGYVVNCYIAIYNCILLHINYASNKKKLYQVVLNQNFTIGA